MDASAAFWVDAVIGTAAFVSAAKAHGRQLRLEREFEGHLEVEFGGRNHPWVERLWRADRIRFWTIVPIVAVGMVALRLLLGWPPPADPSPAAWTILLASAGALWVGFLFNGICSAWRLARAAASKRGRARWSEMDGVRAHWARYTTWGSGAYWSATTALAVAFVALLARTTL